MFVSNEIYRIRRHISTTWNKIHEFRCHKSHEFMKANYHRHTWNTQFTFSHSQCILHRSFTMHPLPFTILPSPLTIHPSSFIDNVAFTTTNASFIIHHSTSCYCTKAWWTSQLIICCLLWKWRDDDARMGRGTWKRGGKSGEITWC